MADIKISALPASTTPLAGTEVLPVVQGGITKKVSVANLTAGRTVNVASIEAGLVPSGTSQLISTFKNLASTTRFANGLYWGGVNGDGADANLQFTDSVNNNYYFGGNLAGAYVVANTNGVRLSSGGTAWASDSDERLKTDLVPISDAVNKIVQLRAVTGRYKTDKVGVSRAFLMAQDVLAVLPEAVDTENPEVFGLRYTEVIPLLVAAIKEQQSMIKELYQKLNVLQET